MDFWVEIGVGDGNVDYALTATRIAAQSGASAVKVQWLKPDRIFHPSAERYDNTSGDWETQADGYASHIYPYQKWSPVIEQAQALGIEFIPAVFDPGAAQVAHGMGIRHVKIASGDITNEQLIRKVGSLGFERVTISTGAATRDEVVWAVDTLYEENHFMDLTLLACHLQYPTHPSAAHLGRIVALRDMYPTGCRIGYSDHTPGLDTIPVAMALGAQVIEKHFTLHPGEGGGDHDFAISPEELSAGVQMTQYIVEMVGNIELEPTPGEEAALVGARRSLYARRAIAKGSEIEAEDIIVLRPFVVGAYPANEFSAVIGARCHVDLDAGDPLLIRQIGGSGATLTVE